MTTLAMRTLIALCALTLGSCTTHWFSKPNPLPSGERPVVQIETRGGVELGAATDHGILFLGRTAVEGPCRVHYFLGDQRFIEDGTIEPLAGTFFRANIDLKHQRPRMLGRDVSDRDTLLALSMRGDQFWVNTLRLVRTDEIDGDVATHPGIDMLPGTPLFVREDDKLLFAGLVAAEATLSSDDREKRFVIFTGADRLREMLMVPKQHPAPPTTTFRPDDIHVKK